MALDDHGIRASYGGTALITGAHAVCHYVTDAPATSTPWDR
jgi:hypothetical protein